MFFHLLITHCHWRAVAMSVVPPEAVLQDAGDVVGVQDAELGLEAQHMAVLAHHAHAQGVEGADQHLFGGACQSGALARSRISAAALLVKVMAAMRRGSRPVSIMWAIFVRDHPRLARARPGQHQAGAIGVVNGLELGEIETGRHGE